MKKTLIMTALAIVALASCNDDESMTQYSKESRVIDFVTDHKATRAGQTITSLDRFTVTAVNADNTPYFNDIEYVYDQGEGVFKSDIPRYWPSDGTLNFYAINHAGTQTTAEGNIPTYTYGNWAGEKDLVAATVKSGVKKVPFPLTFKHLTSQVYVSAEAQDKSGDLTYKLLSVKMTAPSTGTYHFADATGGTGTWEVDNNQKSEYSYEEGLPRTFRQNGQVELSSTYWNILPVADGNIRFEIEYQILQNDQVVADFTGVNARNCTITAPGLLAGKQYLYNFVLPISKAEEVRFTATVSDWEDHESNDITIPPLVKSFELSNTYISAPSTKLPTYQLSALNFLPEGASTEVRWTSDNTVIATVGYTTGLVSVLNSGIVHITATANDGSGVSRTCTIVATPRAE